MSLIYRIDDDGAFVCGDSDSRITAYAYPTSEHARVAGRGPVKAREVANAMIIHETDYRRSLVVARISLEQAAAIGTQDERNWLRLEVKSRH